MNNKLITLESTKYSLRLDNFEGPLDLLCYLIDKNKMDIYKVSISDITDQYIQYLKEQEKLLKQQYDLTATLANGETLPMAVRDGYEFVGWENKYGEIITKASCHGLLVAVWEEKNPGEKVTITNRVTELPISETYQLTWEILPKNAGNQRVTFESSNPAIASVDQNGLITVHGIGEVTIKIISLSKYGHTDTMTLEVVSPEYFDISYETESYVVIGEKIILSHEPVSVPWAFNIHGHDHAGAKRANHLNVCSDVIGYKPVNLNQFLKSGALSKIQTIHRETIDNATKRKQKRGGKKIGKR